MVTETTQLSLIYETFFDDTSAIISVTYFEITVELKSQTMSQSSLHCGLNIAYLMSKKLTSPDLQSDSQA